MKVSQAIEVLTLSSNKGIVTIGTDARKAINLGIEALKAIRDVRPDSHYIAIELLPGETPEEEVKS